MAVSLSVRKIYLVCPITGVQEETTYRKLLDELGERYYTTLHERAKEGKLIKNNKFALNEKPTLKKVRELMASYKIDDEYFAQIEDSQIYVSQYGRLKYKRFDKFYFMVQTVKNHGAYVVQCKIGDKTKEHLVSRLVAKQFLENDDPKNKCYVLHINGKKGNNRAENLKWVTKKDVCAQSSVNRRTNVPVLKICPNTLEVIDSYVSCAEAGRLNLLPGEWISMSVREGYMAGGFIWKEDMEFSRRHA